MNTRPEVKVIRAWARINHVEVKQECVGQNDHDDNWYKGGKCLVCNAEEADKRTT